MPLIKVLLWWRLGTVKPSSRRRTGMKPRASFRPQDYPSDDVLCELIAEIESQQPISARMRVLSKTPAHAHPVPLEPCVELHVDSMTSTFVLSQRRSRGELYTSVCGKRTHNSAKRVPKVRSQQPWPRTHRTDRLRPVALHRWITVSVRGPPPSSEHEASHICGNERCIASAHLQWQHRRENKKDCGFHSVHLPLTPASEPTVTRRFSRTAWLE